MAERQEKSVTILSLRSLAVVRPGCFMFPLTCTHSEKNLRRVPVKTMKANTQKTMPWNLEGQNIPTLRQDIQP